MIVIEMVMEIADIFPCSMVTWTPLPIKSPCAPNIMTTLERMYTKEQ